MFERLISGSIEADFVLVAAATGVFTVAGVAYALRRAAAARAETAAEAQRRSTRPGRG